MINQSEPIWAALPDGRQLNVAPLLNSLERFDSTELNSTDGIYNLIRRTIRVLNVAQHDPEFTKPVDLVNLYADLHLAEDIFQAMREKPGIDEIEQ